MCCYDDRCLQSVFPACFLLLRMVSKKVQLVLLQPAKHRHTCKALDCQPAVFTPTDNVVMAAAAAVSETLTEAGIPFYTGADSFVTAGAFATCGVNYTELGTYTADMVLDILESGNVPEYHVMDGGIITVNTETAAALGIDYAAFSDMASQVVEVTTQQ